MKKIVKTLLILTLISTVGIVCFQYQTEKANADFQPFTQYLYRGSTGPEVTQLQEVLSSDSSLYPEGLITGYFGYLTERAVKRFQVRYSISQTGTVGPITRSRLNIVFGNLESSSSSSNLPDYEISNIKTTPSSADVNEEIILSITLKNKGSLGPVPSLNVNYNEPVAPRNKQNTCLNKTEINSGETCLIEYYLSYSTEGIRTIRATVDLGNEIKESIENNNASSINLEIGEGRTAKEKSEAEKIIDEIIDLHGEISIKIEFRDYLSTISPLNKMEDLLIELKAINNLNEYALEPIEELLNLISSIRSINPLFMNLFEQQLFRAYVNRMISPILELQSMDLLSANQNNQLPHITSITPNRGTSNTNITIYGSNLSKATAIKFYKNNQIKGTLYPSYTSSSYLRFILSGLLVENIVTATEETFQIKVVTNNCAEECSSNELPFTMIRLTPTNQIPSTPTISGSTSITVGEATTYTFSSSDPDGDTLQYRVTWGDNEVSESNYISSPYSVSHTWASEGTYTVVVVVKDGKEGYGANTMEVVVESVGKENQAPESPNVIANRSAYEGDYISFSINSSDPERDNIQYKIDWGDGTLDQSYFLASGQTYTTSHSWSRAGNYSVEVTATDSNNKTSPVTEIAIGIMEKEEENRPPYQPTISGATSVTIGDNVAYTFSSSDPDGDALSYEINWGDGSAIYKTGGFSWASYTKYHTWNSVGVHGLRVTVSDGKGGTNSASINVTVNDSAPTNQIPSTPTISGSTSVTVGEATTYTFSSSDPDGDTLQYRVTWGDNEVSESNYISSPYSVSHTWASEGTYTVVVVVKDGKEGYGANTMEVVVESLEKEKSLETDDDRINELQTSSGIKEKLSSVIDQITNLFKRIK